MILPNSEQMRQIDQCAINRFGIPSIVLMENAGLGTVLLMERLLGPFKKNFVPIFIGPGHNGGDGLVIARHLHHRGCLPLLIFLINPDRLKGDSATNLAIVKKLNLPQTICTNSDQIPALLSSLANQEAINATPAAIIDSIFGTGLDRNVEGHFKEIIGLINKLSSEKDIPVISVDTPSGLSSDRGVILGTCVRADITTTYGYAKVGQVMADSSDLTGELHVIDIGIPAEVANHIPVLVGSIDRSDCRTFANRLKRPANSHKGTFGHLLIIGGAAGKTGAAILAARGAMRSGCGLVSLCAPSGLNNIYETALTEAMTIILNSSNIISIKDKEIILENLSDKNCIVLGPGIGRHPDTAELVVDLYNELETPMVIDADGLNILSQFKDKLNHPPGPRIFTPHPGEMARMTGLTTSETQADRFTSLSKCFDQFQTPGSELIILLKGGASLVSDGKTVRVNRTGNSSMATGGMGDVLSGLIGSLICQGMSGYDAANFGAFLHGFSGDRLDKKIGTGFNASELADDLASALKNIMDDSK